VASTEFHRLDDLQTLLVGNAQSGRHVALARHVFHQIRNRVGLVIGKFIGAEKQTRNFLNLVHQFPVLPRSQIAAVILQVDHFGEYNEEMRQFSMR